MSEPLLLRLLFTRSSGNSRAFLTHPGSLDCLIWLSAVSVKEFVVNGTVVEMGDGTLKARQLTPTEAELRTLWTLAEKAGLTRGCNVEPRVDTSDVWSHNLLRLDLNDGSRTLELPLMATGFEGKDAESLRRFFGHLLNLAGITEESLLRDLAG